MFNFNYNTRGRWLKQTLKVVFLICIVLWLLTSWVGLPRIIDEEAKISNLMLRKNCEETEEKLRRCEIKEENAFKMAALSKPQVPKSLNTRLHRLPAKRLVHLDLKGAPPKMDYLVKLLPTLQDMGATGLLVEYEDMFPYHGYIRVLSSTNAYSYDDIKLLLDTASKLNMEVIPLVQTLGHFEFVLKHGEFRHLRETKHYPNMPCPLHEETLELVKRMVKQVLTLHPHITHIHLGGDEVFNIKDCEQCKGSNKTKEELYRHHMLPLLTHLKLVTNGRVRPIIWDDMLRKWSVVEMRTIAPLVDIMVWGYAPNIENYGLFPPGMWDKYGQVFEGIWVASSFKGALAADNNLVPIQMHVDNHESWVRMMNKVKNRIHGIALTGWGRYDHYATMCELLPAALPSLGLSLQVLKEGVFKSRGKDVVESILGFSTPIVITKDPFGSWDTGVPNFPGGNVYSLIAEYENHVSWYKSTKNRVDSWSNERQVAENKVSLLQFNGAEGSLKQMLPSFRNFRLKCFTVLKEYFFDDAVKEWVKDKVDVYIKMAEQLEARMIEVKKNIYL